MSGGAGMSGGGGMSGGEGGMGGAGVPGTGGVPSMGVDTSVQTALPPLPKMANVKATAIHESVEISFEPVDGARDYRVYALPADGDVSSDGAGHVTVKNALYRCAGDRQAPVTVLDAAPAQQGKNIRTLVDNQDVDGVRRTLADAALGFVYIKPGDGRVPIYAMGDPAATADQDCEFLQTTARWQESRSKRWVTEAEHTKLLGDRWRDDGIAFYVPAAAGGNTRPLYASATNDTRYYYVDGAESQKRGTSQVAFPILTAVDGPDSTPLMRVFYRNICGKSHDEIVAGKPRFERARRQGDQQPTFHLHWSGLSQETTLVVEALAEGCPYQGFLSPISRPANGSYAAWQTLDQLKAQSPTGELYINGQHEAANKPRPIARSFVKIAPGPKPDLDWFQGFGSADALGNLVDTPCGENTGNCFAGHRMRSDIADVGFIYVDDDRWGLGSFLGELWVTYADRAADTNGKFRLTAIPKAQLAPDKFLYATMTVDGFATLRRYPQIIISEMDTPVQYQMQKGHAIVVQTFGGWPNAYQVEVCDHQFWDVNSQCPVYDLYHTLDPLDPGKKTGLQPNAEPAEHVGLDRGTRYEVLTSTKRIYLYLDGEPYACADLPATSVPAGPVTVTFGDVIYHSGVDTTYTYTKQALQIATRRHFDNLGFKSGMAAPAWDEKRLPCAAASRKQ
jgi:hypothetical protein